MAKKNQNEEQSKFIEKDGEIRSRLHPDEPLRSRRDFLRAGLITSAATVTIPSVMTSLLAARVARGDGGCAAESGGNAALPAYFTIDCAGGQAIHSCFPALTADGSLPQNLALLGVGSDPNDYKLVNDFGIPFVVSNETLDPLTLTPSNLTHNLGDALYGLPADIKARLAVTRQIFNSLSDSAVNQLVCNSLVSAAGRGGSIINASFLGSSNDPSSGANSTSALGYTGQYQSLNIGDLAQLTQALGFGTSLMTMRRAAIDRAVRNLVSMSDAQRGLLERLGLGDQLSALFGCAATKNVAFADPAGGGSPDPRTNPAVQAIYGINAGSATGSAAVVEATLAYNTLMGHVPSASFRLGGADYHDNTRTSHDAFQLRLAGVITRTLRLADALGKDCFLHVITDGGISMADVGANNVATGDNNLTSGSQMYYLSKPGRPRVAINHQQAGAATEQGVADTRHYFGDVSRAQHVPIATYLGLAGITSFDAYKRLFKIGSDMAIAQESKYAEAQLFGAAA